MGWLPDPRPDPDDGPGPVSSDETILGVRRHWARAADHPRRAPPARRNAGPVAQVVRGAAADHPDAPAPCYIGKPARKL